MLGVVGELPCRNAFFDAGAFGFLNLTTVPVTRLYVDGRDTGLESPVYGLELSQGAHTLKVVSTDPKAPGWEREHTIRVDPGMTGPGERKLQGLTLYSPQDGVTSPVSRRPDVAMFGLLVATEMRRLESE